MLYLSVYYSFFLIISDFYWISNTMKDNSIWRFLLFEGVSYSRRCLVFGGGGGSLIWGGGGGGSLSRGGRLFEKIRYASILALKYQNDGLDQVLFFSISFYFIHVSLIQISFQPEYELLIWQQSFTELLYLQTIKYLVINFAIINY